MSILFTIAQLITITFGIAAIICTTIAIIRDAEHKTSEEHKMLRIGLISTLAVFILYVLYWFALVFSHVVI